MVTVEMRVRGMTCDHCVEAVTGEIGALPGVRSVRVDLVSGGDSIVTVMAEPMPDEDACATAVDAAGYLLVRS